MLNEVLLHWMPSVLLLSFASALDWDKFYAWSLGAFAGSVLPDFLTHVVRLNRNFTHNPEVLGLVIAMFAVYEALSYTVSKEYNFDRLCFKIGVLVFWTIHLFVDGEFGLELTYGGDFA